jgi:hypothetical protein
MSDHADIIITHARVLTMDEDNPHGPSLLDLTSPGAYLPLASWPDGRLLITRERQREESPGSAETGRRVTPGGGDPRDSATENEPPGTCPGQG